VLFPEILIFLEDSSLCIGFLEGDFLAKKKGEQYKCDECGLVVLIENPCECEEACELICCEEPMKPVKASAKSAASKAPAKPKK
jgi:hypothetical protein